MNKNPEITFKIRQRCACCNKLRLKKFFSIYPHTVCDTCFKKYDQQQHLEQNIPDYTAGHNPAPEHIQTFTPFFADIAMPELSIAGKIGTALAVGAVEQVLPGLGTVVDICKIITEEANERE